MHTPKDFSNLTTAAVVILFFAVIAILSMAKGKAPEQPAKRKAPRRPIIYAYAEMISIINHATQFGHLHCITALLLDFQAEYAGFNSKEEIDNYTCDILTEKHNKQMELLRQWHQRTYPQLVS